MKVYVVVKKETKTAQKDCDGILQVTKSKEDARRQCFCGDEIRQAELKIGSKLK
jgi:hypothetical protein